jgi:hypothetical protein
VVTEVEVEELVVIEIAILAVIAAVVAFGLAVVAAADVHCSSSDYLCRTEKVVPTLEGFGQKLASYILLKISNRPEKNVAVSGIEVEKAKTNRSILIEKHDIGEKRKSFN